MLYGTRGSGSSEKKLFMAPATVFTVKSFSAKSRLWSERKLGEGGQCKLDRSKRKTQCLGEVRETSKTLGCCPGLAWSLGRDLGLSQTEQEVASLGTAKKHTVRSADRG